MSRRALARRVGFAAGRVGLAAGREGVTDRRACLAAGLACLAAGLARPARAQQFLYDPEPPAGSAFLRFVNATGAEVALRPDFAAGRALGTASRVTPYAVVEAVAGRALGIEAAGIRQSLTLTPGSFNTLLVLPGALRLVVDQAEFNQLRARLTFYNATADCTDGRLAILPADQAVFEGLAPGQGRSRAVNPVQAQLGASCAAGAAPPFALEGLEAGGMYSIWLMRPGATAPGAPGGAMLAFMSRDTTERRR